jgi:DNA-binding PadR family transcriptional regulator
LKKTAYVILGLLTEAPMTGYQLKQIIDIRFKFFWRESYGQIFPVLKAMAEEGDIVIQDMTQKQNRAQKMYAITPQGEAKLAAWLKLPVETEMIRMEILLKLYFGNLVERQTLLAHLNAFQKAHQKDLAQLDGFADEVSRLMDQDANHPMVLSVIQFGQKVNRAYLEWADETATLLMKGESAHAETE